MDQKLTNHRIREDFYSYVMNNKDYVLLLANKLLVFSSSSRLKSNPW